MTDILITIVAATALALFWVMLYDSNRFVVRTHRVADARIKKGCRAVVLTDLHNKCYGKENSRLLSAIRGCRPDFIFIAGDLLTANSRLPVEPVIRFLQALAADCPVYYANGNHEQRMRRSAEVYGKIAERYSRALAEKGIVFLENCHASLPDYGLAVYGAELDLKYYKRLASGQMAEDYLPRLLGQAPQGAYTVLLAHNPDYFPQYAAWGADLTVSGHIHGGVARVPVWGKGLIAPTWQIFPKYDGGIFGENGAFMVLSRGLGSHTIPVRMFNPGELWVIEFEPLS